MRKCDKLKLIHSFRFSHMRILSNYYLQNIVNFVLMKRMSSDAFIVSRAIARNEGDRTTDGGGTSNLCERKIILFRTFRHGQTF